MVNRCHGIEVSPPVIVVKQIHNDDFIKVSTGMI